MHIMYYTPCYRVDLNKFDKSNYTSRRALAYINNNNRTCIPRFTRWYIARESVRVSPIEKYSRTRARVCTP